MYVADVAYLVRDLLFVSKIGEAADHRELEARRDAVAAATGNALAAALTAFADLLETHVRREERELFEHFPDGVPPEDAHALGEHIRRLLGR